MAKALPFIHLTWPSGAKGKWRVSSWLGISNTREKNMVFFSLVLLRHFLELEIKRWNVKQTRKIHNCAKELKVVECVISRLIEQFSLSGLLDSLTSYLFVTTLKNLQNPMIKMPFLAMNIDASLLNLKHRANRRPKNTKLASKNWKVIPMMADYL